ncbi:hypothetical protein SGRIM128S_09765 [Streptomyces griseomycini]
MGTFRWSLRLTASRLATRVPDERDLLMSEGTLWSADLGAPLHIDTDANPGLWGYLRLQIDKKNFKEWLGAAPLTGPGRRPRSIELTRKLRRFHKSFYEQTIVTLRDKLQADEAFIYHPVPLTYMPLVVHATRIHCEARDASSCEGITAANGAAHGDPRVAAANRQHSVRLAAPGRGRGPGHQVLSCGQHHHDDRGDVLLAHAARSPRRSASRAP